MNQRHFCFASLMMVITATYSCGDAASGGVAAAEHSSAAAVITDCKAFLSEQVTPQYDKLRETTAFKEFATTPEAFHFYHVLGQFRRTGCHEDLRKNRQDIAQQCALLASGVQGARVRIKQIAQWAPLTQTEEFKTLQASVQEAQGAGCIAMQADTLG